MKYKTPLERQSKQENLPQWQHPCNVFVFVFFPRLNINTGYFPFLYILSKKDYKNST